MGFPPSGGGGGGVSQVTSTLLYSTNYQAGNISQAGPVAEPGTSILQIVGWFDGTPCIFELSLPGITTAAAAGAGITFTLIEDGTEVIRSCRFWTPSANSMIGSLFRRWTHIPPVTGNALTQHEYDIGAYNTASNTNTISAGADNTGANFGPIEFNIYKAA